MTKIAKIILVDEVNALITGVDPVTKDLLDKHLTFFVPAARHMPKYKMGMWDGNVHLFKDGWTYVNLLDEPFLNIIIERGYDIDVIDQRNPTTIHFEEVTEDWIQGIKLRDYQVAAINATNEHSNGILLMATGAGKAQPYDSLVQTPDGSVRIGDLKVGDSVLTVGGRVTTVTGIFPQGVKKIVRVSFVDGRTVECCEEHLWSVFQADWLPRVNREFRTVDTTAIRNHLSSSKRPIYVPLSGVVFGREKELPIHPYLLGALIGDGGLTQSIRFSSKDEFIVNKVKGLLPAGVTMRSVGTKGIDYAIRVDRGQRNSLWHELRSIGLYGKNSHTKFIPSLYKTASASDRMAILQGLFDTDGTVGKNGSVTFCTVSETLARDVQSLLWSVGAICKVALRRPSYTYRGEKRTGSVAYILNVRHPFPETLFTLPRKRERILSKPYQYGGDVLKLQITSISDVGDKDSVCIAVDDPSHLYLANDYVVTHNTNICAGITKAFVPHGKVLTVVPRIDLVTSTAEAYVNGGVPDVGVFYGEEKHVAQSTVTTWQSLVNRPEILGGTVSLILDEAHLYSAKEMFSLLQGPAGSIHHRYGFTGTLPKDVLQQKQLLAGIGPVIFSKSAFELQQEGFLSSCHIHIMETQEPKDPLGILAKHGRPFIDHEQEFNWLLTDPQRLDWLAETIRTIASTGNTIVLMRLRATSDELQKRIPHAIQTDGRMGSDDRTDIYKAVNEGNNAILLATKGVASTGIDIQRLYNVVLVEAGKSFTEVIQMIGRGLRKGSDKDHVDIWDICANTQFSKAHARERKKYYTENKYPFNILKISRQTAKEMFG